MNPGYGDWDGETDTTTPPSVPAFSKLGRFPVDGPWSRREGILTDVPPEKTMSFVHGRRVPTLLDISVSNDCITVGTMTIPQNVHSDVEKHVGDEVLHVLSGEVSIEIDPDSSSSVSVSRCELEAGEKFFIPQGRDHHYINCDSLPTESIFAVAPHLQVVSPQ